MRAELHKDENNGNVKIYINDLLHVSIVRSKYCGLYSYIDGEKHIIEIILKTNTIKLEYDRNDKWETILKLLDTI